MLYVVGSSTGSRSKVKWTDAIRDLNFEKKHFVIKDCVGFSRPLLLKVGSKQFKMN